MVSPDCYCVNLHGSAVVDMGSEEHISVFASLTEIKSYGDQRWWLSLHQCSSCSQHWLVAEESQQNDVYCFKRLDEKTSQKIIDDNEWPPYFETLEELLIIGRNNDKSVSFVDPIGDSSLAYSIQELKKARPNITNEEIASLLSIDLGLVVQLEKSQW